MALLAATVGVLGTLGGQWVAARMQFRVEDRRREHEQRLRLLQREDDTRALHRTELRDVYLRYLSATNRLRRQVLAVRRLAPAASWWGPSQDPRWGDAQQDLFHAQGQYWELHEEILLVSTGPVYRHIRRRSPRYPRHPGGDADPHPGTAVLTGYAEELDAFITSVRLLMREDMGYEAVATSSAGSVSLK